MNMPEIRFKDFKNEWKHFSFKEITYKAGIKNSENLSLESYSISNELGFIPQKEQFENGGTMSKADKRMYYIVSSNSFAYNPARINVGSLGYYQGIKDVIVSSLYEVFKTSDIVDDLFLLYWFKTNIFKRMIEQYQEGGVRLYFFFDKLQKCQIKIPSLQEQQKIAFHFQKLDSLIQVTTKKLASLKQIKAASLQSMFPQEGETVPKVRFKGLEGEWEKEKLGKLFKERIENNINGELLSVTINNGIIKASENGRFDNSNNDKSHYKVVKIGDIVYNTMRMWQGASGYSAYEGIVSPAYTVIIPQEQVFPLFFAYMFKTQSLINRFRIYSQGLTTDTWNLKFTGFSGIEVCFPKSKLEQQKIASYFYNLDKQISLQAQRLEKLKQIKAACLDKMFV
jgi:type I restriction enzyme S subunit